MQSHPFLDSLPWMRTPLELGPVRDAMRELGNPQGKYKIIHVTGTKGKGSTAAMAANGLTHCGLYTSPHLKDINERIQIDNVPISDAELNNYLERVKPLVKKHSLSYFEALTAAAFLYFADKKCDYAVVEVGMGGRLDATNVCKGIVNIITNIDFDHTEILGDTIAAIAREKAGIIKGGIVVTGETKPEALKVIAEACERNKATLIPAKRRSFKLALEGDFQQDNAACAYEALRAIGLGESEARRAVETALWPGRLDRRGNILYDCAHNALSIAALAGYLRGRKFELVFGMKADKDYEQCAALIAPLATRVIVTQYSLGPDPLPAEKLAAAVKKHSKSVVVVPDPKAALAAARGFTVVAGSSYLVGELLP